MEREVSDVWFAVSCSKDSKVDFFVTNRCLISLYVK